MTPSHHLSHLRFGLQSLYALHSQHQTTTTPGLHHLLPIPLAERLILLATIDGADERTIRASLRVSKDDANLTSRRMKRTMQRLKGHLASPHAHWPEVWTRVDLTPDHDLTNGVTFEESNGIAWNRRYGSALEAHLSRLLWADVAVALIGQSVPKEIATLSLKQRLILYSLLVEGITQEETIQIMGCTEWDIDRSLRDGLRAVGGA
jgi:hypothetical protein